MGPLVHPHTWLPAGAAARTTSATAHVLRVARAGSIECAGPGDPRPQISCHPTRTSDSGNSANLGTTGEALIDHRNHHRTRARQEPLTQRRQTMVKPITARKKPVEIQAVEYHGTFDHDIATWCGGRLVPMGAGFAKIEIPTLEGTITASPGDFIIKGVEGEFYPCKPGIFASTYDVVS